MSQAFKAKLEEFTGKNFDAGVLLEDLPTVEECFNLGIYVFTIDDKKVAKVICLAERENNSCYLNIYENHFSYIKKFKSYAKKYQCMDCKRFISWTDALARHKKKFCQADEIKETFVGGKHILSKTVFELCEELGIDIPKQDW